MRIGAVQLNSQANKEQNLVQAEKLIDLLAHQGADLIVLPEHFNYVGPDEDKRAMSEELTDSPSLDRIRRKAVEHSVHIHSGTLLERAGDRIHNTGVVFNPQGEIVARYRKIHLFDVEVPGGKKYLESAIVSPGEEVVTFTVGPVTIGLTTCYDLRFPELYRALAERGAQVILVPAAFTMQTGRDHWELLLRARAVENQCFVVAPNQYGSCPPKYLSYGRTMIIDPWGVVLAQASDEICTISADLDMKRLAHIRESFPALEHIRRDIFD
ncbi:MAG: carbon-nitrogen hydrolase family protein [Desulfocapsaceae bacterium]|nr:carbon-nitrogen hydrolase family protein [Desulfocapsaceae bacterium]